jgi:hypothetical protein
MQSKVVLGGVIAAGILAFGVATPIIAQQPEAVGNLAAARELTAKGAWKASVRYAKDDLVTSRGSTWRSKHDNNKGNEPGSTQPNTAGDWELFAGGLNPSGAWRGSKMYHENDLATHLGETWRAKRTSKGKTPAGGADWEKFAAAGGDGAQGPQGIQGPPGPNTGVPAGSPTTPAISFTGDANTGIFSPAAGRIALVEDGTLFLHNQGTNNTALGLAALDSTNSPFAIANTAVGHFALTSNTSGDSNTAIGSQALFSNTEGGANTALGVGSLLFNTLGAANTAVGDLALRNNTTSSNNTAVGRSALINNTTGSQNVAVGSDALNSNSTGSSNIGLGVLAGANAAANSNNSIFIGNAGVSGDTGVIRLGTTQFSTFIAGIFGVPITGGAAVEINASGQLGTQAPSSRRYKDDVQPMTGMSALLQKLRPVTFRYKQPAPDGTTPIQYGLIAEEVAEVLPALALFDGEARPDGVRYQVLPSLLLAGYQAQAEELRQEKETNAAQALEIAELKQRLLAIETMLPRVTKAAVR